MIVIFDLFDTLLLKKWFDYSKGISYLIDEVLQKKISTETFFIITEKYRKEYMLKRNKTNIEISFIDQLVYFNQYFPFKSEYKNRLYDIEWNFMKIIRDEILLDDVKETLEILKKMKIPIYIISNSIFSEKSLKKYLNLFQIEKYFIEIFSSADYGWRKPSIAFFNYVKETIGIKNEIVYYIGNDYYKDVVGSFNANYKPIWYNNSEKENPGLVESIEIKKIKDMLKIII